jgi:hypothetical protein
VSWLVCELLTRDEAPRLVQSGFGCWWADWSSRGLIAGGQIGPVPARGRTAIGVSRVRSVVLSYRPATGRAAFPQFIVTSLFASSNGNRSPEGSRLERLTRSPDRFQRRDSVLVAPFWPGRVSHLLKGWGDYVIMRAPKRRPVMAHLV